jgi:hypothetical protein
MLETLGPERAGTARRMAEMRPKTKVEVDETAQNPLISPAFKRPQRCRAPHREGTVSRYALRYPLNRAARFGADQRQPG